MTLEMVLSLHWSSSRTAPPTTFLFFNNSAGNMNHGNSVTRFGEISPFGHNFILLGNFLIKEHGNKWDIIFAVAVAQLAERSLLKPELSGSNPVKRKVLYWTYLPLTAEKTKRNEKRGREVGYFCSNESLIHESDICDGALIKFLNHWTEIQTWGHLLNFYSPNLRFI